MEKKQKSHVGNIIFMFIVLVVVIIILEFLSDYVQIISDMDYEDIFTVSFIITCAITLLAGRFRFQNK